MHTFFINRSKIFVTSAICLLLVGCLQGDDASQLDKIKASGQLHIKTIFNPLTYYIDDNNRPAGLDYELLERFSDYLDVELVVHPYYSIDDMFTTPEKSPISIYAAGLSRTEKRQKKFRSSPSYYQVEQLLIYRKGNLRPRDISQIQDPIFVVKNSSHEEKIQKLIRQSPELNLTFKTVPDSEILLRQLEEGDIKLAIVNDITLAQNQYYYPHLARAFTLDAKKDIVWLMDKSADDSLANAVLEFFSIQQANGTIVRLQEKNFGHIDDFDFVDTRTFLRRVNTHLPKYQSLFQKYSGDLDWRLLAATSYQESHWNPRAKSPTGVRGMMMLTWPTAKSMGVTSRLDAEQSIRGGAKYLTNLIGRMPESIPEHAKPWFALAAYNIGFGHLMDARSITEKLGNNPDSWTDVKASIPLLQQAKWYKHTRFGYARGNEAIKYVNNIRKYYDSLRWYDEQLSRQEQVARDVSTKLSTITELSML